jgi:sterol desaturase/sphingolipid hydroxylase (fatty acid hydroxylase superfamily)
MIPEPFLRHPGVLAAMLVLAAVEALWLWRRRGGYDVGGALASFGIAAGQFALQPVAAAIIGAIYFGLAKSTPLALPIDDWRVWLGAFFAVEFSYYWMHRWSHTVAWMWATHAVHHSARQMALPAAIRLGWTGLLSGGWLVFAPLILLGIPPAMLAVLLGANLAYQFLLHTEAVDRLWAPLEAICNTPSHHRAHHASDVRWHDCNFGGMLIVFDRLFGSFVPEPAGGGLAYGLDRPGSSNNPFAIVAAPWQRLARTMLASPTPRAAIRAAFGRPA